MMINDWRRRWGQGDFPFLWAQLPNFKAVNPDPTQRAFGRTRESMAKTLSLPNTGMATTIDIGEARDIHPKNKQDVGRRLANWALAEFYNQEEVPTSGPMYASHEIKGPKCASSFGTRPGYCRQRCGHRFVLAGADKFFHPPPPR